jgi:hypothetical protein
MNAFTQAHKMTKEIIQAGDNYAATFALCLKHIHQKANPMIDMINEMIEGSNAFIARLEAFKATAPKGYIIVTGSGRIPVAFDLEADTACVGSIEKANRFNDLQIAKAMGRKVTNGHKEQGVAVYIIDQIEWEIGQQQKLIADLTEALKKNQK